MALLTREESEVLEHIRSLNAASRRKVLALAAAALAPEPPADEAEFEALFNRVFGGWKMMDEDAGALWNEIHALREDDEA